MSLPFLAKPKNNVAGIIIAKRKSDGISNQVEMASDDQSSDDSGLESAADDILRAISANDSKQLARALRSAFEILDSEPHEEGPHTNPEMESQD